MEDLDKWDLGDIQKAHDVLNALDDAEAEAMERARNDN